MSEISLVGLDLVIPVSASNAGGTFNLRCEMRKRPVAWLQRDHPDAPPRVRAALERDSAQ